jgi:hypothetical protein
MSPKYAKTLNPMSAKRTMTSNARIKSDDVEDEDDGAKSLSLLYDGNDDANAGADAGA